MLSLSQAAKAAGISKSTLSAALKTGRLSYVAKSSAGYQIDPAELFRVFAPNASLPVSVTDPEPPIEPPLNASALMREVELLRDQLADVRADRNAWRDQAQRLALTDQRAPARSGMWSRIRGRSTDAN